MRMTAAPAYLAFNVDLLNHLPSITGDGWNERSSAIRVGASASNLSAQPCVAPASPLLTDRTLLDGTDAERDFGARPLFKRRGMLLGSELPILHTAAATRR